LPNIPNEKVDALLQESILQRYNPLAKSFSAYMVACVGKEFCPFALATTKQYIEAISKHLDQQVTLDQPIRIHISGCPHSCAQPQIADIGLQGTGVKVGKEVIEAFELWLGGSLHVNGNFATKLQGSISAQNVPFVLEKLINFYAQNKRTAEDFTNFVRRIGIPEFQAKFDALTL
jgi:ferredoxin-nitrite reductase